MIRPERSRSKEFPPAAALLRIALIDIARRKLRTSLTVCGIAVGIAAFVALVRSSKSFERQ